MQNRNIGAGVDTSYQNSPYVGPRPFTTADRDIFFGRNQETIELTSLIIAHPDVLLYAPSGAGKTSLLYAQVLPILEQEEDFDTLPAARVRSQESAAIPEKVNNIFVFNALKDLSKDQLSVDERAQLTLSEFLKKRPRPPSGEWEPLRNTDASPEPRVPRVVVFDQFEEIFTLHPERYKDRQDFFAQVAAALEEDPSLRVVFSMREDYIAELDPYADILPQALRTRFRLERLRKKNALACVKRPLETERCKPTGRHFVNGAAESLVDKLLAIKVKSPSGEKIEVPGEFVDPVQLQVVCQTLWEKLPPDDVEISMEDVEEYANVDEALLDFYENSIRKAVIAANNKIPATLAGGGSSPVPAPFSEGLVRGWFEQKLITREGKRNMVNRERDATAGLPNILVDELDSQHLIRVEIRGGDEPWYELSHDRFIPPIRESNRRFLLQQPIAKRKAQELEQRSEEWWNAQQNPNLLLNRGELADAQNWMRTEAAAIGYTNTLFSLIQASKAAIEHEENLQQQALADALQEKATAERQRSRQFKRGLVFTSVLVLGLLGSTAVAINRYREARRAQASATKNFQDAEFARNAAILNLNQANKAWDEQRRATDLALKEEAKARKAATDLQLANAALDAAKKKAEDAAALAKKEGAAAQVARRQAEMARLEEARQRNEAQKKEKEAKSAKYAGDAKSLLPDQLTLKDPELALRLAMMAFDEADTRNAETSLRESYQAFAARRVLKGHGDVIRKAVYSPDGRFIFTASEDHTVKQWNALTNELVETFKDHTNGVHDIAISADGRLLATEAADSSGRIWDIAAGTSIQLADLSGPVAALAFSPDGRLLATEASESEKEAGWATRIWDVRTGGIVHRLIGHTAPITALAFSPDGKLLVTASWDHTARLWDTATGKEVKKLSAGGHTAPLASVAFSPNGTMVVTGSYDSTARIWDIVGQKEPIVLRGHTGVVQSVAFDPYGRYILTSGKKVRSLTVTQVKVPLPDEIQADDEAPDDNSVRLYDLKGTMVRQFYGHTGGINSASFSRDGLLIVTASEDGTAKVWRSETGEKILDVEPPGGAGHNYAILSHDNLFLLVAGVNKTAQVWRVEPVESSVQFFAQKSAFATVAFTDQNTVLTSGYDGVRLWEVNTGSERPGRSHVVKEDVYAAATSPDGRLLVTGSETPKVTVSKTRTPPETRAHLWENGKAYDLVGHQNPVVRVAFSPQGTYILTVSGEAAKVWQTADRILLRTFETDETDARWKAAAFSQDERYVAIGNTIGEVQVFDVTTWTPVTPIRHSGAIRSVAFNTNTVDPVIVTSSDDGTAQVCRVTTGQCYLTLSGHRGAVTYAGFSSDNRLIVTIGVDRVARIWDAHRGNLVRAFTGYSEALDSAALNRDGTQLAVASGGQVFISDCTVCRPIKKVRKLAEELKPRQLTSEESKEFLTFR